MEEGETITCVWGGRGREKEKEKEREEKKRDEG